MKFYFVILLVIITNVDALDILAIHPYPGKSHFFVFRVLLLELAKKGHNVTVISHFPEKEPPQNYHDISLAGTIKVVEDDMPPVERTYWSIIQTSLYLSNSGMQNCEVMLANQKVQDLVKQKRKFNVVIVEQFNSDCALGIAYKLKAPVVGTTSHVLMPYHYERFGIPSNPSYISFHFLEGGTRPSLFQRMERLVFDAYFKLQFRYVTQRADQKTLAKYYEDVPDLEELASDIRLLLLYNNFALAGSMLFPANVIEVGGYHVAKANPLSGDLKKFVEEAKHGIVYISFGSVIKSSMPQKKLQAILDAIKEFPQRFIWKWESETLLASKSKLYVTSWLPQVDILGHNKTLAFFSHAGMGSTIEALHFSVPMIAMPILGDQPSNAAAVEESGLGVQLQYRDLTKENLVAALKTVLDPRFRATVQQVSLAFRDRPVPPLEAAVFWTEFAARHSRPFRTAAAKVPFYQYMFLDVAAILLAVFVSLYTVLFVCRRNKTIKEKKKHQ